MLSFLFIVVTLANPTPLTSQLGAPEARVEALKQIIAGTQTPRQGERGSVELALRQILGNANLELAQRIYAIRAMGALASNVSMLFSYVERQSQTEQDRVIALESMRALAQFAPPTALAKLMVHQEPEIRAIAARVGGHVDMLCTLASSDPWPMVRAAAIYGLSTSTQGTDCILKGLNDASVPVRHASMSVIGERSTELSPIQTAQIITILKAVVKNSHEDNRLRTSAMSTLGALGDCSAAKAALRLYLKSDRLKVLLFESIGALQRCDELNPFLGQMLENKNDQVASLSLRLLVKENPQLGCRALKMRSASFKYRRSELVRQLQADCDARVPLNRRRMAIPDEGLDAQE
jgi:hypothetical protein